MYVGSFNAVAPGAAGGQWANNPLGQMLFEREQQDLLNDLYAIPTRSCDRKARRRYIRKFPYCYYYSQFCMHTHCCAHRPGR